MSVLALALAICALPLGPLAAKLAQSLHSANRRLEEFANENSIII